MEDGSNVFVKLSFVVVMVSPIELVFISCSKAMSGDALQLLGLICLMVVNGNVAKECDVVLLQCLDTKDAVDC